MHQTEEWGGVVITNHQQLLIHFHQYPYYFWNLDFPTFFGERDLFETESPISPSWPETH